MNSNKQRTPVYLTEECYQMLDENRQKYPNMDDSEYLEMLIHNSDPVDDLVNSDSLVCSSVINVLLSGINLVRKLSHETLENDEAIRACTNRINESAEKLQRYFFQRNVNLYAIVGNRLNSERGNKEKC